MSNFIFTNQFYNDDKGRTLPKARLYFYDNNTFNFTDVYSDPELTQVLENPVTADGAGRFPQIFMDISKTYRVWLKDRNDVQVTPYIDDYSPSASSNLIFNSKADTFADLRTIEPLFPNQTIQLIDVGLFYYDASDSTSADNGETIIVTVGGARYKLSRGRISSDVTYLIPSNYPTMQAAIDDTFNRIYTKNGARKILMFESGHEITNGLLVKNGDYSDYSIQSEDAITYLSNSFVGVTDESTQPNSLIIGSNAVMPVLDCLIRADDKCSAGYYANKNALGTVSEDCGVIYAGTLGCYVTGGKLFAPRTNFSYANQGNRITANGIAHLEGANLSNPRGVAVAAADVYALDVSRGSLVYFMTQSGRTADASNSAGRGISCRRSWVAASGADASNAVLEGVRAELGGQIEFDTGNANNCGSNGIACYTAGRVPAQNSTATGCGLHGYYAIGGGSIINADDTDASNCGGAGYRAEKLGEINAADGIANDCGSGLYATNEARINFNSGESLRSLDRGVFCNAHSRINCQDANISNSVNQDLRVQRGSEINANGCTTTTSTGTPATADTNVGAFNAISSNNGIIWS